MRQGLKSLLIAISQGSLFFFGYAWAASQNPLLINQIAIDPQDPRVIYAATRPQGVLKSTDRGSTWHPAREGLTNTSTYEIVVNPNNSKILYLGTFGGGVFKSEDGGDRWFEVNQGLGNTNIHALAINPVKPDQLIVSTSTGELFKTEKAGEVWTSFNEGLPSFPGEVIASFLFYPETPFGVYLAQGGLYWRPFSSPAWQPVGGNFHEEVMTALVYHPSVRSFYSGTIKHGLFRAVLGSNLASPDAPLDWMPVAGPFHTEWIRLIAVDPLLPSVIYVDVEGRGLYKSGDNGHSWKEINTGLPTKDVESMAIDPKDSKRLYVGTHDDGLFISDDGGQTWTSPEKLEVEPVQRIIASLSGQPRSTRSPKRPVMVPSVFAKCNKCHGWTDPALNQKPTYWRVPPNRRDWQPTVRRMSPGAGLNPDEEQAIIRFLTEYSQ
jgi:hypothetical protein